MPPPSVSFLTFSDGLADFTANSVSLLLALMAPLGFDCSRQLVPANRQLYRTVKIYTSKCTSK
jgi:hypothetical protein